MGEDIRQLTDWRAGMSFVLPFVQHHVSQLEVSVHNVFLHGGKRGREKSLVKLCLRTIVIKTISLFLRVAHKHGTWVIRKDVRLANNSKAVDQNIEVSELPPLMKTENYVFIFLSSILHSPYEGPPPRAPHRRRWRWPPARSVASPLWRNAGGLLDRLSCRWSREHTGSPARGRSASSSCALCWPPCPPLFHRLDPLETTTKRNGEPAIFRKVLYVVSQHCCWCILETLSKSIQSIWGELSMNASNWMDSCALPAVSFS